MYGNAIGTLNVLVKTGAGNRSEDIVWTLSGNQQNQQNTWNFGQTTVTSVQNAYQVKMQTWVCLYMSVQLNTSWCTSGQDM